MLLNDFYASKGNLITETRTYKLWESAGRKLVEAELTANQINQLFQQIEQGATAAGGNRTMIGKGKDAASAINKAWEDLKTKVQTSGPVKNVDAMYDQAAEKLKQATGGDAGVMQYVQKYRDFAKAHPVAQSLIYSALIAAAGISGVGAGGAAALGLFKMVDKLLQGEKFSSAAYSGAKTGAMAYAAGQVGKAVQNNQPQISSTAPTSGTPAVSSRSFQGIMVANEPVIPGQPLSPTQVQVVDLSRSMGNVPSPEVMKAYNLAKGIQESRQRDLTVDDVRNIFESVVSEGPGWDKFKAGAKQAGTGLANMARGAATGTMGVAKQASGAISQGIKNVAGSAMQKAQTVGHNLTTNVTVDKLMSAWKKAGSPTDSDTIAGILAKAGVDSGVIDSVYKSMQIPRQAPTQAPTQAPGASTGTASTMSTITNPETGKLYTKAELRTKYGNTPVDNTIAPATTQVTAPSTSTATVPGQANANRASLKQAKQTVDQATSTIKKVRSRDRQSAIDYATKEVSKIPAPAVRTKTTAPTWTGRSTKPAKISAPPAAGAPTSAERANLDQKIQQALAKQTGQPVSEDIVKKLTTLSWSKNFDPSANLLRKIR